MSRRGFLAAGGGASAGLALGPLLGTTPAVAAVPGGAVASPEAAAYYRLLLLHTRWVETLWDEATGHYPLTDFNFVNVLGNAVLLTMGDYDAELAGVDAATLRDHTIRTIDHAATTNFYATDAEWGGGGYSWGGRIYWDGTMESYFVAAARLLWDELAEPTRTAVDAIAIGGAEYVSGLAATEDPRSGGWSSNGLQGGYRGDSKIEEMGAKSMPLATGLAYFPQHPSAPRWREWLTRWMSNMTGLPAADRHNHTRLDGRPVSVWNTAQNLYDSYLVENHGTYAPMYQESVGAYPGRNAIHFLIAGHPLPDVLTKQPNADGLWDALRHLGADAGLTAHPMVNDRYHLYGRDVLPLTWRRLGQRDRFLARGERMLIEHLEPYLRYPPEYRLTKFSGEPKYEPEARAEVAIAYLLHTWRDRLNGDVKPVDTAAYWADASGVRDYGAEVGLVAHQSPEALSMVVTKAGYVKLAFVPEHDDWFLDVSGRAPAFLPSTSTVLEAATTQLYERGTDGFDATATLLTVPGGFAGFATLPGGAAVYATSGHAAGEGALRLQTLTMPGIRGLDGSRTFTGSDGSVTLTEGGGDGGTDDLSFPAVQGRHVRMLGGRPGSIYGYSLWSFEVFAPGSTTDLAVGRPTTVTSYDPAFPAVGATDGNPGTRWAVSRAERPRPDSWIAVDLGEVRTIDRAKLMWDPAFGAEYRIQVSTDGVTWTDAVSVPNTRTFTGDWVAVDDRAGFVVRGSTNPIRVSAQSMTLSDGPATGHAGMVIEAYAGRTAAWTAAAAARPTPLAEQPGLAVSDASGHLTLFNLTAAPLTGTIRLHSSAPVYLGRQTLAPDGGSPGAHGWTADATLDAATARIRPAAFDLTDASADLTGLTAEALDLRTLRLTSTASRTIRLTVTCRTERSSRRVALPPTRPTTITF